MLSKTWLLLPVIFCCCMDQPKNNIKVSKANNIVEKVEEADNPYATVSAIPLPAGFRNIGVEDGSFGYWLNQVKLKKDKRVFLYDGSLKEDQSAQFAVLDVSVEKINLQQCADAVMRLRADYFYDHKQFNRIVFTDNDGKTYQFNEPFTLGHYKNYLQQVFGMCGTASLSKTLHSVEMSDIQPGDVLIRGGFPGHAVIVMSVAVNNKAQKIYLLAQSYMPAQDIHLLVNPNDSSLSPWYIVNDDAFIETPEYVFKRSELKRWLR